MHALELHAVLQDLNGACSWRATQYVVSGYRESGGWPRSRGLEQLSCIAISALETLVCTQDYTGEAERLLAGNRPGSVLMGSRNRLLLPGLLNACLRETTHAVTEYHGGLAPKATRKASRRRSRAIRAPHKDPQPGPELALLALCFHCFAYPT